MVHVEAEENSTPARRGNVGKLASTLLHLDAPAFIAHKDVKRHPANWKHDGDEDTFLRIAFEADTQAAIRCLERSGTQTPNKGKSSVRW